MSDLPTDLVEEILSRIPAITLKRLRSTCKQWNTLFKDSRFAKKHFRKAEKESMALMLKGYRVFPMIISLNDKSIELKGAFDLKHDLSSSKHVDILEVLHCDGLLLCTTKDERLLVWNPCLGEARWIQLKADNKKYPKFSLLDQEKIFTLGYGNGNNKSYRSYKILKFCCCSDCKKIEIHFFGFEIYEFSSDSWRFLDDIAFPLITQLNGVSLKGNSYWLAYDVKERYEFLLSFDFTEERFKRMFVPPLENFSNFKAISVVGEEQLSVLKHNYYSTSKIEIWLSNKIGTDIDSVLNWSKFFTMDLPIWGEECFWYPITFSIDEDKKVVVCCRGHIEKPITIITIGEQDYLEIPFRESPKLKYIFSYVPSLVQIQ